LKSSRACGNLDGGQELPEPPFSFMEADTVTAIAAVLQNVGCPPDKCPDMAQQLHRRAGQLADAKGRSYEEALGHLLRAMAGGWAAQAAQAQDRSIDPLS